MIIVPEQAHAGMNKSTMNNILWSILALDVNEYSGQTISGTVNALHIITVSRLSLRMTSQV
jgi:hypothetical protein